MFLVWIFDCTLIFLSFGLVYDRNKMTLAWRQTIYFHCHMTCVILIPFSQESFYSLAKLIFSKLEWKVYSGDWNDPFPFVYRHRMSSNSSCIHSFIRLIIGRNLANWTDCTAELVNITGYNFVSNHRKSKTGNLFTKRPWIQTSRRMQIFRSRCNWVAFLENYCSSQKNYYCWLRVQTTKSKHCYVYWKIQQYSLTNF